MPDLKTVKELGTEAVTLAQSFGLIRHNYVLYIPTDYETGDDSVTPDPLRTVWIPLTVEDVQRKATEQFDTLFNTEKELVNFVFKVEQVATQNRSVTRSLLVRTTAGLKELKEDGLLHDPSGMFIPNTLIPVLNEDPDDQAYVMSIITGWLNSEEEAVSLLRHLATALAPGWSAVKYILLLGAGRNGKSLLLKMVQAIFGKASCSGVTRQEMAVSLATVTQLNGKLVNLVYDGLAKYLEDSAIEKTLVAGESADIRRLYQSDPTPVQTNALFIEGLNQEPKTKDKSTALQARLVRYQFPNTYPLDNTFADLMTSERYVGALLALLIQHYVKPEDAALLLAPTAQAMELQLEYTYGNSHALPFLEYVHYTEPLGVESMIGWSLQELTAHFNAWRQKEHDAQHWDSASVLSVFRAVVNTDRKSERVPGAGPRKVRVITGFKSETLVFIESMKEGETEDATTVVDEGPV